MAPVPSSGHLSVPSLAAPSGNAAGQGSALAPRRPSSRRWPLLLAALLLLHLSNPLTRGETSPGLWYPPAGLALALIAWFGRRAVLLVAVDGLLVVLQAALAGRMELWAVNAPALGVAAGDALSGALILGAAWWVYRDRAGGALTLRDPRSATLFLFLLPGAGAGLWAAAHTALSQLVGANEAETPAAELTAFWLSRALGLLVLAPVLLVVLTPWLWRRGLAVAEENDSGLAGSIPATRGDLIEMAGLAAGATLLTWLLVHNTRSGSMGWPLWGAPLLLILWAGLRQGLRGSTTVAGFAAGLPLLTLREPLEPMPALLVEGNLLSQCAVALLVAASANWVRLSENRYRQVVAHVPVVIYSARFTGPPAGGTRDRPAEVTLVSAAGEFLLGCPAQHLLGDYDHWLARVHPDDREVVRAAVAQVSRPDSRQPVTCEYRLAPTGEGRSNRWVRDTLAPHRDSDGQLLGWEGVLTDVTEQRVLADDLRRTTSMLHALVGNLPTGVFFVQGPRGHPLLVNARARQLLGQREELAAGLEHLAEVYRLFRPDGTPYPVEELPVYLALRKGLSCMRDDIVVHRTDGRRIPLVTWAAPVTLGRDHAGDVLPDAAVWVLADLTALHQAEAARRDSEGRLRTVLDTMAGGLLVQDRKGAVVECNATAGELFGQPVEQLLGQTLAELPCTFLREDGTLLPLDEQPAETVLRLGRPVRNLVLGIRPHGSSLESPNAHTEDARWVLANAMPLVGAASRAAPPAGVVTTFIDISAYVQAQRMIRISEEKYRRLVESLPLMVVQADRELRLTYTNPATEAITGYALAEVSDPRTWASFVHPDDLPAVQRLANEALNGRSGRTEFRYRAKDGSEKVGLSLSAPNALPDGTIAGTTTLIVDVTRERQLEQDLHRAQRLELVGRLSSGIVHDFNNMLSVVLSLTELVRSNLPADHPTHDDLSRITEASEQAANLAGQLLIFSKQRTIARRRVDVNQVARRTLELLRATLPPRIELRTDLTTQDLFIQADETQVQQVLMNLCLNGRDAMPDGGLLQVRTALVSRISSEDRGSRIEDRGSPAERDWVRLSIQDSGLGMNDHIKAHLFDPFFSTKDRGTGLGLAVVQQIVESHGGHVEVSSEPGHGARFDVWWPRSGSAG